MLQYINCLYTEQYNRRRSSWLALADGAPACRFRAEQMHKSRVTATTRKYRFRTQERSGSRRDAFSDLTACGMPSFRVSRCPLRLTQHPALQAYVHSNVMQGICGNISEQKGRLPVRDWAIRARRATSVVTGITAALCRIQTTVSKFRHALGHTLLQI